MAMEQQMEMFGVNPMGGLDDDGLSRDPVSGNEIPPGSMANEVRDDVDARLSDGEYVVPANVVRFFGVKFFEELRTQAMQGLDTMEANGRIGGEPMPSAMPMQDQMANSSEELSEQDMAMLQNIMNEGGDVRGYVHGGYHDPVNDPQPIPQSIPSSVYPLTQYATPGASTMNPALNPNIAVTPTTPTTPVEDPNAGSGFRFVTMVNPGTGEIQVVQFKGDVPVDPTAYNQLINSGFYVQGSEELARYKQEASRDSEQDQSVQDGTKPANRQTVGELLWSAQTGIYNEVFPDSLSAGISKLGSFGALGQLGKMLPDGPSRLEQSIREAEKRLERGKDYQGVAINAAEKAALELLVSFKGETDMTKVYDAIYNRHGIHTGGKSAKYKRDIRVPDFTPSTAQKTAAQLIKETKEKPSSDDVKIALDDDGSDYGVDPVGKPYTKRDGSKTADYTQSKEYKDQVDRAKAAQEQRNNEEKRLADYNAARRRMNEDNNDNDNNQSSGNVTAGTSTAQEVKDFKEDFQKAGGTWASGGRAKGGLIKKPTKKKKIKK